MATRNALAVAVPLAIGIEAGNPRAAVALAIGALNVSYSDGRDPYRQRAARMLTRSALLCIAVFLGALTGANYWAAILLAALWSFTAGMMMGLSTRTGDLGLTSLVTLIVFAARGATTPLGALYSALLVFAGGCIQILAALLFWPLRRNKPQVQAIGEKFLDLSAAVDPDMEQTKLTPVYTVSPQIEDLLSALGSDHTLDGERSRLLYDQADRLRLSIYLVTRLRDELGESDNQSSEVEGDAAEDLDHFLRGCAKLLAAIGQTLKDDTKEANFTALRQDLTKLIDRAQGRKHDRDLKLGEKIASALDVVAGQLRLVTQLAENTTEKGAQSYLKGMKAKPWKLQPGNWRSALRANFAWSSPVFRHALRLCVCVTLADAVQRGINWQRAYWIPMTAAVVLKPDFSSTFSRGALRLAGTMLGLFAATLVYHALPVSGWTQFFLVGAFAFFLRYWGPANYGVFTLGISGLIVFLLAATGVSPANVVVTRAMNTVVGGLLALAAYAVWPTWERHTISDSIADMLDAMRDYFKLVAQQIAGSPDHDEAKLDQLRKAWQLKRTAAAAAVDRVCSEPGLGRVKIEALQSILASARALAYSVMGLEAGLAQSSPKFRPEAYRDFAKDVDLTLYSLGAALRGSKFANANLPQLREDHRRLLEARDAFEGMDEYVLIETDRLTVSLNTLREQVERFLA